MKIQNSQLGPYDKQQANMCRYWRSQKFTMGDNQGNLGTKVSSEVQQQSPGRNLETSPCELYRNIQKSTK